MFSSVNFSWMWIHWPIINFWLDFFTTTKIISYFFKKSRAKFCQIVYVNATSRKSFFSERLKRLKKSIIFFRKFHLLWNSKTFLIGGCSSHWRQLLLLLLYWIKEILFAINAWKENSIRTFLFVLLLPKESSCSF